MNRKLLVTQIPSARSTVTAGFGAARSSWQGHGREGFFAGVSFLLWWCFEQQDFVDFSFVSRFPNPLAKQQHKPGPKAAASIKYKTTPMRIMETPKGIDRPITNSWQILAKLQDAKLWNIQPKTKSISRAKTAILGRTAGFSLVNLEVAPIKTTRGVRNTRVHG